jgi:hypothetical protein
MTSTSDPKREPGYPGALPPRDDTLARPWILIVLGIFVLIVVLSLIGIPSRFVPDPTPIPVPSFSAEPLASPSESADGSGSPEASSSPDSPGSASPSAEASASP